MGLLAPAKFHANRCTGVGTRPLKSGKFPLFGKDSPRRGEPFDPFLQLLGAFMRSTTLRTFFKFDVICFTDYGVIAEKPGVGHLPEMFRAPCRENYALDRKMIVTF